MNETKLLAFISSENRNDIHVEILDLWILNVILKDIQDSLQESHSDPTLTPLCSARGNYQIFCCVFEIGLYLKNYVISFIVCQIPPESFLEHCLVYCTTLQTAGKCWADVE